MTGFYARQWRTNLIERVNRYWAELQLALPLRRAISSSILAGPWVIGTSPMMTTDRLGKIATHALRCGAAPILSLLQACSESAPNSEATP